MKINFTHYNIQMLCFHISKLLTHTSRSAWVLKMCIHIDPGEEPTTNSHKMIFLSIRKKY